MTSAVSWPSSMSCLTSFLWRRPRPTTRKAPTDFETLCPDVEQDKRAALFRCRPLAFPHRTDGRRFIDLRGGFTVRLNAQVLEQMKSVDIGAVAPESLADVSGMTFNNALPKEERIACFLQAVKNPYCFCIGGVGVKIEFAESGPSLQDTLTDFLLRQKSGL